MEGWFVWDIMVDGWHCGKRRRPLGCVVAAHGHIGSVMVQVQAA